MCIKLSHVHQLVGTNISETGIEALKKMLENWEAMFKDSFEKWRITKEKLELINKSLMSESKNNKMSMLTAIFKNYKN